MEAISKALFWLSNSLLIPDIILLLLLFGRSVLLVGGLYSQFMTKRKTDRLLASAIKNLTPEGLGPLRALLPQRNTSLFVAYLRDLLTSPPSEAYSDYLLSAFENRVEKELSQSRLMAKIGPVLGLIGTLIAMSPALVGLSTGDVAGMAYNMQIVFATTVVGLVISGIGLVTLQVKQRWYAAEVNKLDYVARTLQQGEGQR